MSHTMYIRYIDIDGQHMELMLPANYMFMFALFKIIAGALTVYQGRSTKNVFKPILKEYQDAERGITQGIVIDKRRSKIMKFLKKKILKITLASVILGIVTLAYVNCFTNELVDQWIDQKYDYIE